MVTDGRQAPEGARRGWNEGRWAGGGRSSARRCATPAAPARPVSHPRPAGRPHHRRDRRFVQQRIRAFLTAWSRPYPGDVAFVGSRPSSLRASASGSRARANFSRCGDAFLAARIELVAFGAAFGLVQRHRLLRAFSRKVRTSSTHHWNSTSLATRAWWRAERASIARSCRSCMCGAAAIWVHGNALS